MTLNHPRTTERFFGAVVGATDFLPPRIRYGYVHRLTRVFRIPLPAVTSAHGASTGAAGVLTATKSHVTTAVLAADHLDVGGIGAVIEMLALRLGAAGVRAVVVCDGDGDRARQLRSQGIEVLSVDDPASAVSALQAAHADVIQLHSAPAYLEQAAIDSGLPLVVAMHNTEIHFSRHRWRSFDALMRRAAAGVAVSEIVREFHARHLSPETATPVTVIPNGAPTLPPTSSEERAIARRALGAAIGVELGDDVVFVCLARYDAQKNVAGTVASFLAAPSQVISQARLVFAGTPSDWAELRRADGIRRAHAHGDRVHLLGNSDAVGLLRAADVFVLNSFFEGWPVAATEAAAAGLPLLLSDVGGAAELVGRDPDRSVLIPNATGLGAEVTDARVRIARRASTRQTNKTALVDGLSTLALRVQSGDTTGALKDDSERSGITEMVAAHAEVLRGAALNGVV